MKRSYVNPMIAIEHYALSQAIAACATKIGFLDSECVLKDIDSTDQMRDFANVGFFTEKGECDSYAQGMDDFDAICYHTNANAAFNS